MALPGPSLTKSAHSKAARPAPKSGGASERVKSDINYVRQPLRAKWMRKVFEYQKAAKDCRQGAATAQDAAEKRALD